MNKIILASQSPRRKELLTQIGIEFECMPSSEEEVITTAIPAEAAKQLAKMKAVSISSKVSGRCILAADTVVECNEEILGKPKDEQDAKRMLKMLSGNKHTVHTGVCIINQKNTEDDTNKEKIEEILFVNHTDVYMNELTEKEIDDYIKTKEPMDKAGAYGIQGRAAAFISKIDGDYNNVVGLPLCDVYNVLKNILN